MDATVEDVQTAIALLKGGGAAGAILLMFVSYVVRNERKKREDQDRRIKDLEDTTARKPDLEKMEENLTKSIETATHFLNQRITDMVRK